MNNEIEALFWVLKHVEKQIIIHVHIYLDDDIKIIL